MNKNYKIIFFDVDNTLYPNDTKIVPQSTIGAIKKAKEKGILICLATGRNYPLAKMTGIFDTIDFDYYVLCNGSLVLDKNKNIIYGDPLDIDDIQKMLDVSKDIDCNIVFHTYDDFYCYNNNLDLAFKGLKPFNIPVPDVKELNEDVYMLNLFVDDEYTSRFSNLTKDLTYLRLKQYGYDVFKNTVNKSTGIKHLLEILSIDVQDSMAFGDGKNDIEMLSYVGTGVCMGNGVDEAKKVSNYITTDINDNGISNALKHFNIID
jgi:Cof subfamily protein (haloacid dehalogenase superfamily)